MAAPSLPSKDRVIPVLLGLICVGLLLACYWPAMGGKFIWNDPDYVTRAELQSAQGLQRIWMEPGATQQYYPVLHSAFWLQYRIFGYHALGYHVVTLALHAAAAVLFALVLRRLEVRGAWLAALLFAFHPVHVQSVAWITEQKNTLSLVLYLAAALFYLRFNTDRRPAAYFAALALFTLSLLAKTMTATLPAALWVVVWWKRGRLEWRRDILPLAPWLVLGAVSAAFSTWVEHRFVGAQGADFTLAPLERVLVAGRAWWLYALHLAWPFGLNFIYPRWTPQVQDVSQWIFPLGVVVVGLGLWAGRHRSRAPLAVFLLFSGSLVPVLGFVNLYGALYSWVWDHWQYLPDLAPLALAAAGLANWAKRFKLGAFRHAGLILGTGLLVLFGSLSWRHTALFLTEEGLYRLTLHRNPSAWMFHNNLAILLASRRGEEAAVREHYEAALRLRPAYADAHFNFARFLASQPDAGAEAQRHLEAAVAIDSGHAEAHHLLANLLAVAPDSRAEAIAHYQIALRQNPDSARTHTDLAGLLAAWPGREAEALAQYQTALQLDPGSAIAHNNLANLLATQAGGAVEARYHYEEALRLKPGLAFVHTNFANLLADALGDPAAAIGHYQTALQLDPAFASAHYNLGRLLARLPDRRLEAIGHLRQALSLQADFTAAQVLLASLLAQTPEGAAEAGALYEAVLSRHPDNPQMQHILALLFIQQGKLEAALIHNEKAAKLAPDQPQIQEVRDYLRKTLGR